MSGPGTELAMRTELEAWHPAGRATRQLAIGALAEAEGLPVTGGEANGELDLVMLAPDGREAGRRWIEDTVSAAAARLATDGLLWLAVPRGGRRAAERSVRAAGLTVHGAVLTVPPPPRARHLIAIDPAALREGAMLRLGYSRVGAAVLGGLAATAVGQRLLYRVLPGCALLAGREGGAEPLGWLAELGGLGVRAATVSTGSRDDARVATVLRYPTGARTPDLAVKIALNAEGSARLVAERRALERLGGAAAAAGARVPAPRRGPQPWQSVTPVLSGVSAAAALGRHPRRLVPIVGELQSWLLSWNTITAVRAPAAAALLSELACRPARRLVAAGVAPEEYAVALESLAGRLRNQPLAWTATHNDLTLDNVLVGQTGLGVLDWEAAAESGLPLTDLWYLLSDALARAEGVSHADAVQALVLGQRPAPAELSRLPEQHADSLSLAPAQALLAFHACWLHHADNELARGSGEGPFSGVVRDVARTQLRWPEGG